MAMLDSFELQTELSALGQPESYEIPHEDDFADKEPNELLEAAVEQIAENSDAIRTLEIFDVYRYLLKHAGSTPGVIMGKLLDSITSGLRAELEATTRDIEVGDPDAYLPHKLPLELYAFLLAWFAVASEKVKSEDDAPAATTKARRGRGGKAAGGRTASRTTTAARTETWSWQSQIPDTLKLILRVLALPTPRIWTTTVDRNTFLTALTRPAYRISELEAHMKLAPIRSLVYEVLCVSVKSHGQGFVLQNHVTTSLQFYEHMSESMAECLWKLATTYDHVQTGDEVLRELAGLNFTTDSKTARATARFLTSYAELYPRAAHRQLALLLNHQDSESYPMRQAIIEILGFLIRDLSSQEEGDAESKKKTNNEITGMFSLIFERMLDTNAYVRTKIFTVLTRLCEVCDNKFPRQRLKMTGRAIIALEDKSATVRKGALGLLVQLLLSHPYNMPFGGPLRKEEWKREFDERGRQLEAVGRVGDAIANREEDEGEEEEGKSKKKRKGKKKKARRSEDEMDVDGEEEEGEGEEEEDEEDEEEDEDAGGDTEEDEPDSMPVDEDPRPRKLAPRKSQINVDAMAQEQAVVAQLEHTEFLRLKLERKYYKEGLNFIEQLEGAMEVIVRLLGSKSKAEVLEAIEFFKRGAEYQLGGVQEGIRKMIHLIWVKDNNTTAGEDGKEVTKGVRQKLMECYKFLYFDPIDIEPRAQIKRISKNLIERTYEATLAELTSLEEMLRIMMEENYIHRDIIAKLWQIYSSTSLIPHQQRRGAIIILGMLGVAKPTEVLAPQKDLMLKVGLGKLGKRDLTLARYTCIALQRLNGSAKKVKGSLEDKTIRYPMNDPVFGMLLKVVLHPCRSTDWFGLTEQAINTVYALGEHPDEFCNELIKKLAQRTFGTRRSAVPVDGEGEGAEGEGVEGTQKEKGDDAMDEDEDGEGEGGATQDPMATQASGISAAPGRKTASDDVADSFELSQLLFVVGHVAIKQTVFLELVEREWKRQKEEKQAADKAASASKSTGKKDKEVDELDQVAGNAEDEIGDRIAAVRENELLFGSESLLAVFAPIIVQICGSPHKFKNRTLRAACHLSLCKLLCVSSMFTDKHHHLLFKILETSRDPNIRANSVIALGDVAVSFNTIIDENSAELYRGLLDGDPRVKKTTLMVLTHLILNGMVKVKGQLGEMAKCVEDEDERIQDLAKLFFSELAGKDNAIYNNLPDIISHLSGGLNPTEEEKFQSTMKYIFTFIEKERQAESIVEKLCQRFRATDTPRQWRDIAFCLSELPFKSERSVKKLIEGLQFYRDKLHEPEVFAKFTAILTKARANKAKDKPDAELDEFEKILDEHRVQGEEDQALQNRAAKKLKKRAKAAGKGKKKAAAVDEDE
ncbi:hypothetical protein D9611_010625 [Ephemerocybe angulata]|uniref:Condensin complex subunit 1 n=1 Tax=Ephemerocybe angulata TaxID=980116 RepID=A0A8H5FAU6_9AGAR|nr:hypothetical protein D9611_010625 [Tulosesus angulatus]